MRKYILSLILLLGATAVQAQLLRWVVEPKYDNVHASDDGLYLVADSADFYVLWSNEGKCLFRTKDHIYPFREGRAVLTRPGSKRINGICLPNGDVRASTRYDVANDYPYYSEGVLVVKDIDRAVFFGMDTKKLYTTQLVADAKPFFDGVSACLTYDNIEKQKNPHYFYLAKSGDNLNMYLGGKAVAKKDIQYVSSIGGDGFSVVVIKNKVYKYEAAIKKLIPFLDGEDVSLAGKIEQSLNVTAQGATLTAKSASGTIVLTMDNLGVPVEANIAGQVQRFTSREQSRLEKAESPITALAKDGQYAICLDGAEILPAQFEEVGAIDGTCVAVRMNGKWGMLQADTDPSHNLEVTINGGADLYFTGGSMKTFATLTLPVFLTANETTDFTVDSKSVKINKQSRSMDNTPKGNYVEYDVTISGVKGNTASFPITITYDGLRLNPITVSNSVTKSKPVVVQQKAATVIKSGGEIRKPKPSKKIAI